MLLVSLLLLSSILTDVRECRVNKTLESTKWQCHCDKLEKLLTNIILQRNTTKRLYSEANIKKV